MSKGKPKSAEHRQRISEALKGNRSGPKHPNWGGGKRIDKNGYVRVWTGDGPYDGYAYEHRVVMERHLGRKLKRTEHLHHRNDDRQDNRIENLELVSPAHHNSIHKPEQQRSWWKTRTPEQRAETIEKMRQAALKRTKRG
jgi:hypothetical protein